MFTQKGLIKLPKCNRCGAEITWIKTTAGKKIPVDPRLVAYWIGKINPSRIVTANGQVLACELDGQASKTAGMGFIPHFATCPDTTHKNLKAKKNDEVNLFND